MEFSRQEYWSGLPCPPPGDLPHLGIEPGSPALQVGFVLLPSAMLASGETKCTNILISDFQPPELRKNSFLLFKPPIQWYFGKLSKQGVNNSLSWDRRWTLKQVSLQCRTFPVRSVHVLKVCNSQLLVYPKKTDLSPPQIHILLLRCLVADSIALTRHGPK